jgi:hypothetical protein
MTVVKGRVDAATIVLLLFSSTLVDTLALVQLLIVVLRQLHMAIMDMHLHHFLEQQQT